MKFYGIEKLSLVDYDEKVASTLFTGGCNFNCHFCHNSPLVNDVPKLTVVEEDEVLSYFKARKGILDGVCITGGEPTLNSDLPIFCAKLKELGLSVKVDTNGTNPKMLKELIQQGVCDYVAMDIKNSKEDYAKIIGFDKFDTSKVEESVEYLMTGSVDFEFRTTLISEFHNEKNMEQIGKWIKGAKKYMLQKFKEIETCITHGLHEVDIEKAKEFKQILLEYVSNTNLRGYD